MLFMRTQFYSLTTNWANGTASYNVLTMFASMATTITSIKIHVVEQKRVELLTFRLSDATGEPHRLARLKSYLDYTNITP